MNAAAAAELSTSALPQGVGRHYGTGGGGGDIGARAYVMLRRRKCIHAMALIPR